MALTHDELCQIACRFLQNNGFKVAFHDRFRAWTPYGEQADAIGFRNGASCLIEAKCSRSDLLADRKKPFRVEPEKGMGDWRFMISEPGIVNIEDLQPGWGLLHVVKGRVKKVHGWPGAGRNGQRAVDIVPGAQSLQRLNHRLARAYRKRVLIHQRECRGKCRVPHALSPRAASAGSASRIG